MSYGILLLRVVLGLTLAAHGAQKLFGVFGGGGPQGTAVFFRGLGFRAPLLMALAAGLAEFGGGLLLAVGLLTPLAALGIAIVQLMAIATVHWRNGFWNTKGGYEFNLLIWAAAVALAATGGGRFSADRLVGWTGELSGLWWGVAVAVGSAVIAAATLLVGRSSGASAADEEAPRPAIRRAA
jgi:putative oxidoreductase